MRLGYDENGDDHDSGGVMNRLRDTDQSRAYAARKASQAVDKLSTATSDTERAQAQVWVRRLEGKPVLLPPHAWADHKLKQGLAFEGASPDGGFNPVLQALTKIAKVFVFPLQEIELSVVEVDCG